MRIYDLKTGMLRVADQATETAPKYFYDRGLDSRGHFSVKERRYKCEFDSEYANKVLGGLF